MRPVRSLAIGLALACVAPASAQVGSYTITDIGTLGGPFSHAWGLNNSGQVTGNSFVTSNVYQAFRFGPGGITAVPSLGGTNSIGYGVNDSGVIVGGSDIPFGGYRHAFTSVNGVTTDLGTLVGGNNSEARAIDGIGQVTGTASDPTGYEAFRYQSGVMTGIGRLGGNDAVGMAINSTGVVAGYSTYDTSPYHHPFVYQSGTMTDLGTLGGPDGQAFGINDAGKVVGGATPAGGMSHAFVWANGVMTDLGGLGGVLGCAAYDINSLDQIVGSSSTVSSPNQRRAFLCQNGVMVDLNTLLPAGSGWTLIQADAINDAGQIVAFGFSPPGTSNACLLTPVPVPEPSALSLIAFAAAAMAYRRIHRWGQPAAEGTA
jgi:probable HAF family extracellular repeat protein